MADFSALKTSIQNYIKQNGNEEITGNLLQQILLSMVSTLGDSAINDLVTALNAEIANRGNADTELGGRITTLQGVVNGIVANVENGYVYAGIATPSSTPTTGKVFYLALTTGTYTNFGNTAVPQGINILKYNGSAWSLDSFLGLDDAPTQGSNNLVKSGGVLDSIIKDGSAFDLSAYNSGATYADLSAALTALNALPAVYKKGGMSVKFVQTSDNKYVQYRYIGTEVTGNPNPFLNVVYWQSVESCTFRDYKLYIQGSYSVVANQDSSLTITFNGRNSSDKICGYTIDRNGYSISFYNSEKEYTKTYNVPRVKFLAVVWKINQSGNWVEGELQVLNNLTDNSTPVFFAVDNFNNIDYNINHFGNFAQGNDINIIRQLNDKISSETSRAETAESTLQQNITSAFCRNYKISIQGGYQITENNDLSVDITISSISASSNVVGYVHDEAGRSVYFFNNQGAQTVTYHVPRVNYLAIVWNTSFEYGNLQVLSTLTDNCTPVFFAAGDGNSLGSYLSKFGNMAQGNDILIFNKLYNKINENSAAIASIQADSFYDYPTRFNGSSFYLVARQGAGNFPNQSLYAYDYALKIGYNTLLIDVRLTSDGYFVASHDATINAEARNSDGTTISSDFTIADHTLAEINNYDFGIKYGSEYAGMHIPLIEDFIKFCGLRNCPFILEFKVTPPDAKITELGTMLRKYNVEKLAILHGIEGAVTKFSIACPLSPLGFSVSRFNQNTINWVMAQPTPNNNERWMYIGNWQNPVENTIADLDACLDSIVENNIKLGYTNTGDTNVLNTLKQHGYLNVFKYLAFDNPVTFRTWIKNNW